MRRFWPLLAIALAGALGWWIAPPASVSQMGGEPGLGDLGAVAVGEDNADIASQLATIYTRKVWSSRNPAELLENEGGGTAKIDKGHRQKLEGFDRFLLLGIIRVAGVPEALFENAGQGKGAFLVSPGDFLNGTEIRVDRIEGQRVLLSLGEQVRWVKLYPDYRPNDDFEDTEL